MILNLLPLPMPECGHCGHLPAALTGIVRPAEGYGAFLFWRCSTCEQSFTSVVEGVIW